MENVEVKIQLLFNGNHTSQFAIVDIINNKLLYKGCYFNEDYKIPYKILKGITALKYADVKVGIIEEEYIDNLTTNKRELELFKLCDFDEYEEY